MTQNKDGTRDYTDPKINSGSIITKFLQENEIITYLKNPEDFKLPQFDLPDFFNDLQGLINAYRANEKEFKASPIGHTYTFDLIKSIGIQTKVLKRGPGVFEQTNTPFAGTRNFKPTKRDIVSDPEAPGYQVVVNQHFYDNLISIIPYSKNARNADDGAYFLEEFIQSHMIYFRRRGLINLRYMQREEDTQISRDDLLVHACPLTYYIRTYKLHLEYEKTLETLNININKQS